MIDGVVIKTLVQHQGPTGFFCEIIRTTDDFFQAGFGQLSHSLVHPGVVKGWHGHVVQTQFTYVASGLLNVVLQDARPDSPTHQAKVEFLAGDGQPSVCYSFPPGVLHGYKCLEGPANVIYVTSGVYDLTDEVRVPLEDPSVAYHW